MTAHDRRPRLHLTPRRGWLNDPLALTWRPDDQGGRYHLFFQHVPDDAAWAAHCHWGHATGPDLLHWEEQPVALAPADDELGAWSGCLVEGTVLYTSVLAGDIERGRVRVARPTDDGWQHWVAGEVVVPPPDDPSVTTFRDPFVVRDGDVWRMLVGAGLADGTGCALGYVSTDLTTWEPTGVVAARHTRETDPVWAGSIWECPQLLRLPGSDVLVVSPADAEGPGDVVAALGSFADGRFEVASWHRLTAGAPYAASVFTDRDGRPGLVTWLRGVGDDDAWAGAVSLPLVVTTDGSSVGLEPHPELAGRRRPWQAVAPCWEVEWEVDREAPGELLLLADDGPAARLEADRGRLVLSAGEVELDLGPAPGTADGPVRIVRDGPVLEVLSRGRLAAVTAPAGALRPEGHGWRGWALA